MRKLIGALLLSFAVISQAGTINHPSTNYAALDLLVWQVREGGADNWSKTITPADTKRTAHIADAPFPWKGGVRVTLGHFFKEQSDIYLAFTHYNTTAKNNVTGIVYSSLDANYFANNTNGIIFGPNYGSANVRWRLYYNNLDIELAHDFRVDSLISLRPHFGVDLASINQNIYTNWYNPTGITTFTSASENLKNNFSGIGPAFGVDSLWSLYSNNRHTFNLVGNISTALVCGQWTFKDIYNNNTPVTITVNSNSVRGLSPMLDGILGVQWSMKLPSSELSVRLGYEEQIWLNQMQIYFLDTGKMNRSTTFQGGDLQIKFNF